jgi:hypothetical protein
MKTALVFALSGFETQGVKGFRAGGTKAEEAVVTCNEWEVRIERQGHESLAPGEAGELEAHLAECASCRAYAVLANGMERTMQTAGAELGARIDWLRVRAGVDQGARRARRELWAGALCAMATIGVWVHMSPPWKELLASPALGSFSLGSRAPAQSQTRCHRCCRLGQSGGECPVAGIGCECWPELGPVDAGEAPRAIFSSSETHELHEPLHRRGKLLGQLPELLRADAFRGRPAGTAAPPRDEPMSSRWDWGSCRSEPQRFGSHQGSQHPTEVRFSSEAGAANDPAGIRTRV